MKLSSKAKKQIWSLLKKLNASGTFTKELYFKLLSIIEHKENRSLPMHHLYFAWITWLCQHFPPYHGIHIWSVEVVHDLLKKTQEINSTAFNTMDQKEFQAYFDKVKSWAAINVLNVNVDVMMKNFEEHTHA